MYDKQKKELDNIMFKLVTSTNMMFYGLYLTEIGKFFDKRVPTACLAKHKEATVPVVLFNPDFWDKLNDKQRLFLILHEGKHLIEEAFMFSKEFGMESPLDNIAMDLAINSQLLNTYSNDLEFIEGGQLPSNYPELKMEECKDSLYYYNILKKAKDKKEESKGKEDSLAGEPGNQKGSSGCKELDKMLDNQDLIDKHPTWAELTEGLSDMEKEILKREVQSRIEKIAEEVQKANGDLPVGISERLGKIRSIKETVSWKALFRKFIGSTISSDIESNRKRPNKRFDDIPSSKHKFKVSGLFASDSSGSVTNDELERCNAELYNVWKAGGSISYVSWDADVDPKGAKKYDGKLQIERTLCGGTDLNCAIRYANQNYKKFGWNFNIITTDGHVPPITVKAKIPTLILITKNGTLDIQDNIGYKKIKMIN